MKHLPNEKMLEMLKTLTPIGFIDGKPFIHIISDKHDLACYSYIWDKPTGEAIPNLHAFAQITTFHTYGAPSLFKPSIAEVLSQVPEDLKGARLYFHTVPDYENQFTADDEMHRGITTFYSTL